MRARSLVLLALVVPLGSCGSPADALVGPLDDPYAATQSRCSVKNSPGNPLIVEWAAADRGSLEMRLRRGLVVVRYQGCELEVLRHCKVPGVDYDYGGFTRKAETVRMRNADELYANLPVGAAKLEGRLERAKALEVSMTMVGMFEAQRDLIAREQLRGDCDTATHVIGGVQVGAYAFFADGQAAVSGAAGLAKGPKIGAGTEVQRELIEQDGSAGSCEQASSEDDAPPDGCGALLRLELVPIGASMTAAVCPDGTTWDGRQCSSPGPSADQCPAGFADRGEGCEREMFCPPGLHCGSGSGGSTHQLCPAGMSRIPGESASDSYCLDDTEVTSWAYAQCVADGGCPVALTTAHRPEIEASQREDESALCNAMRPDREQHPMNCINWHAADTYCRWRGARLPTEYELTWAAAGGDLDRPFPWGDAPPSPARVNACGTECRDWFSRKGHRRTRVAYDGDDGWPQTAVVGSFPAGASRWGPLDLAGNVAEWTSNWADAKHETRRVLGGSFLVQRAAWLSNKDTAKALPVRRDPAIGFRCAD